MKQHESCIFMMTILLMSIPLGYCQDASDKSAEADCNQNGVPDSKDIESEVRFLAGEDHGSLASGYDLIHKDIDLDGDVDLLVLRGDDIAIYRNEGDGTFVVESLPLAVATRADAIIVEELDGDGYLDIAITFRSGDKVRVVFGMSDGSFSEIYEYEVAVEPGALESLDIDNDGDLDLITSHFLENSLTVIENLGDREFQVASSIEVRPDFLALAVADFDGDNAQDIVVATHDEGAFESRLAVYFGDAASGFQRAPGWSVPPIGSLEVADLDGDGDADIVTSTSAGPGLIVSWNVASGDFGEPEGFEFGPSISAKVADVSGDGAPDIVLLRRSLNLDILTNDGSGSFPKLRRIRLARYLRNFTLADIDGDEDIDFAFITEIQNHTDLQIYENLGDGVMAVAPDIETDQQPRKIYREDLNGDLLPEVVVLFDDRLDAYQSEVEAGLVLKFTVKFSAGETHDLLFADLDADGLSDMVAIRSGFLDIYRNVRGETLEFSHTAVGSNLLIAAAFLNLDGESPPEIAAFRRGEEVIRVFKSIDDRYEFSLEIPMPAGREKIAVADMNGDGLDDFVLAGEADGLSSLVVLKRLSGALTEFELAGPFVTDMRAMQLELADLDGDGFLDALAAGRSEPGGLVLAQNDGFGNLSRIVHPLGPFEAGAVTHADFDGDGDVDVVATDGRGNSVVPILNEGAFVFRPLLGWVVGKDPRGIVSIDFDMDGDADFITSDEDSNSITILENQSKVAFSRDANENGVPDECEQRFVRCDANSDYRLDIGDAIWILNWLFYDGEPTPCADASDCDDSGRIDLTDALFILNYQLFGGEKPPAPVGECSADPSFDTLDCELRDIPEFCPATP